MVKIKIKDFTNTTFAISANDGEKVYDEISKNFKLSNPVTLDFDGIELTITAFLNSAIGNLYGAFPNATIKQLLKIEHLKPEEVQLLKIVIERAKIRFDKGVDPENDIDLLNGH